MKYTQLFDAVEQDFGKDVAIATVIMVTLNVAKNPTLEELKTPNLYTENLIKQFKTILWETDQDVFDLALKCWENYTNWEIGQTMHGIGGCTKKSFKELVGE